MRHLRWIVPAVLTVLLVLAMIAGLAAIGLAEPAADDGAGQLLGAFGGLLVLAIGGLLALTTFVIAIVQFVRAVGRRTDPRGPRPGEAVVPREQARQTEERLRAELDAAWAEAVALKRMLVAREMPPTHASWTVRLRDGEVAFREVRAGYARFYGNDLQVQAGNRFYLGSASTVTAWMLADAIDGHRTRRRVEELNRRAWRDQHEVTVVVTDQRLLCQVAGDWLTFDYAAMDAVYPQAEQWTLVCSFGTQAPPLMLSGPWAPLIGVLTVARTFGPDAVAAHPDLAVLGA